MEAMAYGEGSIMLKNDFKRYTRSQGVSIIHREGRYQQQYQLFQLWANLIIPFLPEAFQQLQSTSDDLAIKIFHYLVSMWQCTNIDDEFFFDLQPTFDEIEQIKERIKEAL